MLISEDNILELIPQRPPMVMIGSLVSCDERQATATLKITGDNIFVSGDKFTAQGMLEAMAQTAAARTGYLVRKAENGPDQRPPVGVIGSIKNLRVFFQPKTGTMITTTIEVEHEVLQATIIKGKVEAEGKLAAESNLQIYLTE